MASRPVMARDLGEGPAVVLLHGQPGEALEWEPVAARLADRARVIVPDRPGYGRTGGQAVGVAANADVVVELLDHRGVASAIMVGHSWGGAVALDLALRHVGRVAGLVLVASVGGEGSIDRLDRVLTLPVVGPLIALGGVGALRVPFVRRLLARVAAPSALDAVDGLTTDWLQAWRSFVVEQRALVSELPAITAGLGSIRAPAVVVIGEADRLVRPASQEALAEGLGGSTIVRVPGVGHLLPLQAPSVVADAILTLTEGM